MSTREDLHNELSAVKQLLRRAGRMIDEKDPQAAASLIEARDGLRSLLTAIESTLAEDVSSRRLNAGLRTLSPSDSVDPRTLREMAVSLSDALAVADRLIDLVHPAGASARGRGTFWPRIAIVVTSAIAVGVLAYAVAPRNNNGLTGQYFFGTKFGKIKTTRIDKVIDFDWGRGGPIKDWRAEDFSIRWNGYLRVPSDGRIDLKTTSDDGVRLYLGDRLLIDDWEVHGAQDRAIALNLQEGYYPIRIEYFEFAGTAMMKLKWALPREGEMLIPANCLVPSKRQLRSSIPLHETLPADAVATDVDTFRTRDGLELTALYSPPRDGKGTLVLLHGLEASKEEWRPFSRAAEREGWGTFAFDARGHGQSVGPNQPAARTFGRGRPGSPWEKMADDITDAVKYLTSQGTPVDKITVLGSSMGGNTVALFGVHAPPVHAIVSISPGLRWFGIDPVSTLQDTKRPKLVIAGADDKYSYHTAQVLKEKVPSADVWLESKGHGMDLFQENDRLTSRLLDWIEDPAAHPGDTDGGKAR